MSTLRALVLITLIVAGATVVTGAEALPNAPEPTIVGDEQLLAIRASLVGQWSCEIGPTKRWLRFDDNGQFEIGEKRGLYTVEDNTLVLRTDDSRVAYEFGLNGKELTLSGGDLIGPVKFTKVPRFGESGGWRATWSWAFLKTRARRIAVILLAVIACLAAVRLVRIVMHVIVYSEWGPLKLIYSRHKKRTMTIYSLVLNISKYILYLLAIGFILTELGVNYTMYFASLSVIGLAIGFGSQGLVQDMVTGFFIVFEEQFNVGDMVEIPPHTGIVEELGLRMTRLRNYLGQRVVIPNRNIAVVGNYVRGAQQVYLDVAVAPGTDIEKAADMLKRTAREIAGQFQDIILSSPKNLGEVSLATGEHFLRLQLTIWPQQQWVIDQEMVPRIRGAMKSEGVEIPHDKIVVFYHQRESHSVSHHGRSRDNA
jgi:moderate conductance mechanosensitive channel